VLRGRCSCGLSIGAEQHESEVGPDELALAAEIWGDLSTLLSPEKEALALSLFCWGLLLEVARARRGRDIVLREHRLVEHAAKWLKTQDFEFEASVDGIHRFLEGLNVPIHLAAAATWLDHLLTTERLSPTLASSLPIHAWREKLRAQGAPERRLRSSGLYVARERHEGLLLRNQVARSLGLSCGSMARLVDAAGITVKEDRRKERAYRLLEPVEVGKLEAFLGTYVNCVELARILGIRGRIIPRHLRKSGHLRRAPIKAGMYYLRQDVSLLLNDLHQQALPWDWSLDLLDLTDERIWRDTTASVDRELLDGLRNGTEPLYRRDSGVGLQQFGVSIALLPELQLRVRTARQATRSKRAVDVRC